MSSQEYCSGRLIKVGPQNGKYSKEYLTGLVIHEAETIGMGERWIANHDFSNMDEEDLTDYLVNEIGSHALLGGFLYRLDVTYIPDAECIMEQVGDRPNVFYFTASYYNGGASLHDVLEEAFDKLESK